MVGAGFSGLAAAYELVQRGFRPIVLEAESEVGGLAAAFQVDGARVERFYHHWFTNDQYVIELLRELGLEDRVRLQAYTYRDVLCQSDLPAVYTTRCLAFPCPPSL